MLAELQDRLVEEAGLSTALMPAGLCYHHGTPSASAWPDEDSSAILRVAGSAKTEIAASPSEQVTATISTC